jgi:hypothetical protein
MPQMPVTTLSEETRLGCLGWLTLVLAAAAVAAAGVVVTLAWC